jgi:predicted DNA-binding transcriptional regulator AlpA
MSRARSLPPNLAPRGIHREEAAAYIGIGATLFDSMMRDGRMPRPKQIGGRKVWDVRALDRAFDSLPDDSDSNPWDSPA